MNSHAIQEAAAIVRSGGLVAYPTDTVYGVGCDPFNLKALEMLAIAKKRVKGEMPILVDTIQRAREMARFSQSATRLAERFWPGPLTVVAKAKVTLPSLLTGSSGFVGLRIPRHTETLDLIEKCGGSLIGTSANLSGNRPPVSAQEVLRELQGRIDLVLDGGPSVLGVESTVVRVDNDEVSLLREGAISRKEILGLLRLDDVKTA